MDDMQKIELGCAIAYHNQKVRELQAADVELKRICRGLIEFSSVSEERVRQVARNMGQPAMIGQNPDGSWRVIANQADMEP